MLDIISLYNYVTLRAILSNHKWHHSLPNIEIKYIAGLPDDNEWNSIKPNSLCILDDLFTESINNQACSKAFKIYLRKRKFSILLVTQVSSSTSDVKIHLTFYKILMHAFRISSRRDHTRLVLEII